LPRFWLENLQNHHLRRDRTMKKIVVIGPESTGKSTLSSQLAQHYRTRWCPEYAREYLLAKKAPYDYDDLLKIAQAQANMEDRLLGEAENGFYFIDTEMYVMKVWCEVAFGKCHSWILKEGARRKYDFYLLCDVDLPWQADELREYPDLETRRKLFLTYKDILVNQSTPWAIISGTDEERLKGAINIIDRAFK
jgi:NadR type nicotinamide-nucleotide adenylyltransferase